MTDDEMKNVQALFDENKAANDKINDLEARLERSTAAERASLDEMTALRAQLAKASKNAPPAPAFVPKTFHVKVLARGGVILPGESEATPFGFTVKVEQARPLEGHAQIDVERAVKHLEKLGHVEIVKPTG